MPGASRKYGSAQTGGSGIAIDEETSIFVSPPSALWLGTRLPGTTSRGVVRRSAYRTEAFAYEHRRGSVALSPRACREPTSLNK